MVISLASAMANLNYLVVRLVDPMCQFMLTILQVLKWFQSQPQPQKFDSRITGSETVDSFLNEIITIIINDYVSSWYSIVTDDEELTACSIRKLALAAGVNVANRFVFIFSPVSGDFRTLQTTEGKVILFI